MKLGTTIYQSRLTSTSGAKVYSTPIPYTTRLNYLSVQTKTGYMASTQYGKDITQYSQIVCRPYSMWIGVINVNDLFYIEKTPTSSELIGTKGAGADYVVVGVAPQNQSIVITLHKRA